MRARIFALYLSVLLGTLAFLEFGLLAMMMWLLHIGEAALWFSGCAALGLVWLLVTRARIKRMEIEMVSDVAILLYPLGIMLVLGLSGLFFHLTRMWLGPESKNPFLLAMVGLMMACFIFIKGFDIKWMRRSKEIPALAHRQV